MRLANPCTSVVFMDQVYSNTRVLAQVNVNPTRVNTNQHESDTSQPDFDSSQHKSDTSLHESTQI